MKSSSSDGPRSPAFNVFWLSFIPVPWFVVKGSPVESSVLRSRWSVLSLLLVAAGTSNSGTFFTILFLPLGSFLIGQRRLPLCFHLSCLHFIFHIPLFFGW